MSTASVQNIVAPPVARANKQDFSSAPVEDPRAAVTGPTKEKTDFRTLINNSMDEVIKERKAKENGDLTASSDAEFLEKLADQTKEKRVPKNELGKDDFLKLFVTQLQNQNPLNPEADTEMAAKLAQFNGLEQMLNVNKSLEKMLAEQNTARNLQMVNYVGRDVVVDGGRVKLNEGKPSPTQYKVEQDAAQSVLEVRNNSGILVHQIDMGPVSAGTYDLKWDGKSHDGKTIPDGTYTLSMTARNIDGKALPVSLSSKVRVTGIDINSKEGVLYSDFGRIKLDQIKSVGVEGFDHKMMEAISVPQTASTNVSEDLDRMKAEGKLALPGKVKEEAMQALPGEAVKKAIDQRRSASAKLNKEIPEKAPIAMPATAQELPQSTVAAP